MLRRLSLHRYAFTLIATTEFELNEFIGSTLRGALGGVFRRLVCVTQLPRCDGCLLRSQCAYGYLFKTPPPPDGDRFRNASDVPRPFILEPPPSGRGRQIYRPGDAFSFHLTLIGRADEFLPYVILVFRELERHGIGQGRSEGKGRFHLARIELERAEGEHVLVFDRHDGAVREIREPITDADIAARVAALPSTGLTVEFLTPTRLHFQGRPVRDLHFDHLVRALLRRLSALIYLHCGRKMEADYGGLIEQARVVNKVADSLRWHDQRRYSARQRAEIPMGGLVGRVTFTGDLSPFLPLLVAGEWVHVGKGYVMGMGRYRLIAENGHDRERPNVTCVEPEKT